MNELSREDNTILNLWLSGTNINEIARRVSRSKPAIYAAVERGRRRDDPRAIYRQTRWALNTTDMLRRKP